MIARATDVCAAMYASSGFGVYGKGMARSQRIPPLAMFAISIAPARRSSSRTDDQGDRGRSVVRHRTGSGAEVRARRGGGRAGRAPGARARARGGEHGWSRRRVRARRHRLRRHARALRAHRARSRRRRRARLRGRGDAADRGERVRLRRGPPRGGSEPPRRHGLHEPRRGALRGGARRDDRRHLQHRGRARAAREPCVLRVEGRAHDVSRVAAQPARAVRRERRHHQAR